MLSVDFLNVLNGTQSPAPWVADVNTVNEGLPILAWQISGTTGMQAPNKNLIVSCLWKTKLYMLHLII